MRIDKRRKLGKMGMEMRCWTGNEWNGNDSAGVGGNWNDKSHSCTPLTLTSSHTPENVGVTPWCNVSPCSNLTVCVYPSLIMFAGKPNRPVGRSKSWEFDLGSAVALIVAAMFLVIIVCFGK